MGIIERILKQRRQARLTEAVAILRTELERDKGLYSVWHNKIAESFFNIAITSKYGKLEGPDKIIRVANTAAEKFLRDLIWG